MERSPIRTLVAVRRPRVAAELARPHAEEALLLDVVTALGEDGQALATALDVPGTVERLLLWGLDPVTGDDGGDPETDLLVVTDDTVAAVEVAIGRPGHAAARAARGEPVPAALLARVSAALGVPVGAAAYPPARLAAAAVSMAEGRTPLAIAIHGRAADLLHPNRDAVAGWLAAAAGLPVAVRAIAWSALAARLPPRAAGVVERHPSR